MSSDAGRQNYDLALKRAETMYRWLPRDPNSQLFLGYAQYRTGSFQQSIKALEASIGPSGKPSAPSAAFLAMSYRRVGNSTKALEYLEIARAGRAALERNPDNPPVIVERTRQIVQEAERLVEGNTR